VRKHLENLKPGLEKAYNFLEPEILTKKGGAAGSLAGGTIATPFTYEASIQAGVYVTDAFGPEAGIATAGLTYGTTTCFAGYRGAKLGTWIEQYLSEDPDEIDLSNLDERYENIREDFEDVGLEEGIMPLLSSDEENDNEDL